MISWYKYPFVKLLVPFIIGIYVSFSLRKLVSDRVSMLVLLIVLSMLFTSLVLISLFIKNYRYRWIFSALLFVFLLLLGFSFVKLNDYKLNVNDISCIENCPKYYLARLIESPSVKEKSIKVMMDVYGVEDGDSVRSLNSKIMAYFEKEERSLNLKYGDCLLFFESPEEVAEPPNPKQFDYKEYLFKRGITHQVYLKSDTWVDLGQNETAFIYKFSYHIRDFLLATMKDLGLEDDEFAVASAILLGYDDSLPQELRQKYVAAGAMHILCVSGLHVGVIFMVFSYMFVFIDERKNVQRILKQLVLLVLIWFYALLSGLAPSILRATIMLSFVIIGNIINRKGVLLNSLAASAFILLCINPANLFDIGFLLSYFAVLGIVIMQKPISRLFYFKYNIFNKIWEITSVTIAAQIATTPFTIYYFHQFPIYFWLSNLFMTPISTVVIVGGMIMLLIFFLPYINNIVAFFVSKMIFLMNYCVSLIESLPYSIVKGLYIDEIQFVILLLILLSILFLVELKSKKMLFFAMMMSCLFLMMNMGNMLKRDKQEEMVIFSINNKTAIDFICGKHHLLLVDSSFFDDKSDFSYNIENFLVSKGVFYHGKSIYINAEFDGDFVKKRKSVVTFGKNLIGLSDGSDFYDDEISFRIPLDYMIVYGNKRQSLDCLLKVYSFDNLIIDGSVPPYLAYKFIDEAEKLGIEYHNIRECGSFSVK